MSLSKHESLGKNKNVTNAVLQHLSFVHPMLHLYSREELELALHRSIFTDGFQLPKDTQQVSGKAGSRGQLLVCWFRVLGFIF